MTNVNVNPMLEIGNIIDSLDGVDVYFNGGVNHVLERNQTKDGYNIGLRYQCVEFIKRYYLEHFKHQMPNTYGHAKDFFDPAVKQGEMNANRGLKQYQNGDNVKPEYGDILVYKPSIINPYGHVAIVSNIDLARMEIEIIQQNAGPFSSSRETYLLSNNKEWYVINERILGWLRL